MEISRNNRAAELANLLLGVQESSRQASQKPAEHGQPQNDRVQISTRAQELHRIHALSERPDPARTERMARLQTEIAAGTYDVTGRRVADALIRDVLRESVL